jgi:hypothetical protein
MNEFAWLRQSIFEEKPKSQSLRICEVPQREQPRESLSESYGSDLEAMFESLDFSAPREPRKRFPWFEKLRGVFKPSTLFGYEQWRTLEYRNEFAAREGERINHCPIRFHF